MTETTTTPSRLPRSPELSPTEQRQQDALAKRIAAARGQRQAAAAAEQSQKELPTLEGRVRSVQDQLAAEGAQVAGTLEQVLAEAAAGGPETSFGKLRERIDVLQATCESLFTETAAYRAAQLTAAERARALQEAAAGLRAADVELAAAVEA